MAATEIAYRVDELEYIKKKRELIIDEGTPYFDSNSAYHSDRYAIITGRFDPKVPGQRVQYDARLLGYDNNTKLWKDLMTNSHDAFSVVQALDDLWEGIQEELSPFMFTGKAKK